MKRISKKAKNIVDRGKDAMIAGASNSKSEPNLTPPPRITNDTVAEHREEVLASARKYIYPLQHSKHRIVGVSIAIFVLALVIFFSYTLLALYKFHTNSTFIYKVTQVLPFPVAKAGSNFVAYENYLFDIRRYMHYYETQQDVDFSSKSGKEQLAQFRQRALQGVIDDAYVKQLAKENSVSVSRGEVNQQIQLLRDQNRLGGNDQVFEDVLREFWGWSVDDFRRELSQQLLAQKVIAKLDTKAQGRANEALAQLTAGTDFAAVAKNYSDDEATKESGGEYGIVIDNSNREIPPQVMAELLKLQPGQTSKIIQAQQGLEIVKVYENNENKIRAGHILFKFQALDTYLGPIKDKEKPKKFISL